MGSVLTFQVDCFSPGPDHSTHTLAGNVRELKKACKLVMALRNAKDRSEVCISEFILEEAELTKGYKSKKDKKDSAGPGNTQYTDEQIINALAKHKGIKSKAAKEIGSAWNTIDRRSKKIDT